ncbi:MAG: ABC transporter substrate-binding protein [Solirubrobacteraceae bacterium]
MQATSRALFAYRPNTANLIAPDLAAEMPTTANGGIADGGKTVTVHIRKGIYFSPPVNRQVTSFDVAFAMERGANPNVGNAYWASYFGSRSPAPLQGAQSISYAGGAIPGIQTPNRWTIVFRMMKPGSTTLIEALSLPLSAPLPRSFVAPLDKHAPTTYGTRYLVSSGPYMVDAAETGKIEGIGYQQGKSERLVRNPNWNPKTDFRPAYLDRININVDRDATAVGQRVLNGSDAVQLDSPAPSTVTLAYQQYAAQITFTPGSGEHYLALDNAAGPFKNIDLRRAVWAALDRRAIVKARGGSLVASPATHFIYPGSNGFEQAGGYPGPQLDFNQNVNGNPALASKYMKRAGFRSGKYTGAATLQVVGDDNGNDPAITQIVNSDLTSLGFKTHVIQVSQATMYTRYCGVPGREIDVCPNVGWIRDFADPVSLLYPTFYGPAIAGTDNVNWGQVNDPTINAAMQQAALLMNPAARDQAWANVDKRLVNDAVAVPEEFDNQPNIKSRHVLGINDLWNGGTWDYSFTSLN